MAPDSVAAHLVALRVDAAEALFARLDKLPKGEKLPVEAELRRVNPTLVRLAAAARDLVAPFNPAAAERGFALLDRYCGLIFRSDHSVEDCLSALHEQFALYVE